MDGGVAFVVERSNTILYCSRWAETVDFYRRSLGMAVFFENDWFVEFAIQHGVFLSVADARRATVPAGRGAGITLSWQVSDIGATRAGLINRGIVVSPITTRWRVATVFLHDPEGNRIEVWSGPCALASSPANS